MPVWAKVFLALGGCGMLLAVAMGAFGAHALKRILTPDLLAVYKTAVDYHFYHALGLLAIGSLMLYAPSSAILRGSGILMAVGLLLFSGSLYVLALSGIRWIGAITPLGGISFLLAWLLWIMAVMRMS